MNENNIRPWITKPVLSSTGIFVAIAKKYIVWVNIIDFYFMPKIITFTFMHLADAFIQSDLQCIQAIHFLVSTCVPWESNPQPLRC